MAYLKAKDFLPGQPKILAFRAAGVTAPSSIGDPQVKWMTAAGDTLYLDSEPAGDIEREMRALGIGYGDEFRLTRAKTSHGGSRFVVERLGDSGGHNVPGRSGSGRAYDAPVTEPQVQVQSNNNQPNYSAPAPEPPAAITPTQARFMAGYKVAVDVIVATQQYLQHVGLELAEGVRFEDIRALAATIMIDQQKGGGR